VSENDRAGGILGRMAASTPERTVPASSVDVLLVNADADFRAKMAGLLRRNSHTVIEAESAAAASAAVRSGCAPRLLVLDLEGYSGSERSALAALPREPACAGAPVLVLSRSGNETPPGLHPAVSLLKPVDASELVEAVRRLCGTLGS
jgi:DNA-binding NtrC family response regulator